MRGKLLPGIELYTKRMAHMLHESTVLSLGRFALVTMHHSGNRTHHYSSRCCIEYCLSLTADDTVLLYGRKRAKGKSSNYVISMVQDNAFYFSVSQTCAVVDSKSPYSLKYKQWAHEQTYVSSLG